MRQVDNPRLLDCHFKNGMMILPYYHSIIQARINQQKFAGEETERVPKKKQLLSLLLGLKLCRIQKKKIVIFSSTLFNVQKSNKYHNCLHGYYYDLYPKDTLLIEDSDPNYMWRTKDSCSNLSFINTYLQLLSSLLVKVCHKVRPIRYPDYNIFVSEYPSLFSTEMLSRHDYYTKIYACFLRSFLKKVDPKVVIVNCGSYGHDSAIVCYVAKQLGIKVIEPQHGVTYNCPAYFTSDVVARSVEYMDYLPDTFFSFGDYWNDFVKWKYEKMSVGYQYLNEHISREDGAGLLYDYLIISQPMNQIQEENDKVSFVKSLSQTFPEKRILFRIHPSENFNQQKAIYQNCGNIEISNSTNVLYENFNKCKNIIGWYSNCLYECLAFKRVPIIIDTPLTREAFPHNIGIWVKTADDLKKKDIDNMQSSVDYSRYWAPDFVNNVKGYIDKLL